MVELRGSTGEPSPRCLAIRGPGSPLRALERDVFFRTLLLTASDGRSALRIVRQKPVDLLLLDPMLPDEDGFEVLRQIRHVDPMVPVIVVAPRRHRRTVLAAARLGVAGYFIPPIDMERLLRRMIGALSWRRHAPGPWPGSGVPRIVAVDAALHAVRGGAWRHSVGDLARTLGIQPRRLRERVQQTCAISLKAYMVRTRLEQALAELRETNDPLKAIAARLGFCDAAHLAKDVVRLTRITPGAYRLRTARVPPVH
jgi:YesN/AraC family two-component response regulator